mmetsp:Transcript_32276/g.50308  ORF Transcript_32276/g.50308 Transcript_32276/m.50308 type:complete len:152 (+) Transcript_32276:201-656(+)
MGILTTTAKAIRRMTRPDFERDAYFHESIVMLRHIKTACMFNIYHTLIDIWQIFSGLPEHMDGPIAPIIDINRTIDLMEANETPPSLNAVKFARPPLGDSIRSRVTLQVNQSEDPGTIRLIVVSGTRAVPEATPWLKIKVLFQPWRLCLQG